MEPTRVREFVIEGTLGAGGMATVYLARQEPTGAKVALKLMHAHLASDPQFVKRFLREIAATAELAHENVVRVIACGEDRGGYFIASEFVEGGTLEGLLARGVRTPAAVAAELARQLFAGLEYAHGRTLVHRDIKPGNLLLTRDGLLKIGDFGIARSEAATALTQTGGVLGTPAYMSPEQAEGQVLDLRSDLFSAGVVLYELLAGLNPYVAENAAATMVRILRCDPPLLAELAPATPPALVQIVERLLARDRDQRYSSAAEARAALEAWLAGEGIRGRAALAAFLRDPAATAQRANAYLASRCVAQAKTLLERGADGAMAAALELHRALEASPGYAPAEDLLAELRTKMPLSFGAAQNPKILELEARLAGEPPTVGLLTQLGGLYRLEGNLWKASLCLRKALRLRPNDGYLAGQLSTLTGERVAPTPGAAPRSAPLPAPLANAPVGLAQTLVRAPPAQPATDLELHTGRTGEVRPRFPTGGQVPFVEPLVPAAPPPPVSPALQLLSGLWASGGKTALVVLAVALGLVWAIRAASRGIDKATEEQAKAVDLSFKVAEARAQAMVGGRLQEQQQAWARRYGDELDSALEAAQALARAGEHLSAAEAFGRIAAQAPDRPIGQTAQFLRGRALLLAGRGEGAAAELEAFLERNPAHGAAPEAQVLLAEALLAAGRFGAASDAAERVPDASPFAARAHLARGRALLQQGEREGARREAGWIKDRAASTDPAWRAADELLRLAQ